uniref:SA1788 family PVL leukocidin-associated protein n=1 Tax=Staphylococcus aureus TaxID=1280 RepID=UPI00272E30FB
ETMTTGSAQNNTDWGNKEYDQLLKVARTKLERQRKKEAELRRKKPHLFNVPQKHSRDPDWFDTTYNQMFKKWQEA